MEQTKTERMYGLVDQWRASGQTQKVFCGEHGVKVSTFSYWVSKKKLSEEPTGGFLPVQTEWPAASGQVLITYPNGVTLSVKSGDLGLISQLIHLS